MGDSYTRRSGLEAFVCGNDSRTGRFAPSDWTKTRRGPGSRPSPACPNGLGRIHENPASAANQRAIPAIGRGPTCKGTITAYGFSIDPCCLSRKGWLDSIQPDAFLSATLLLHLHGSDRE